MNTMHSSIRVPEVPGFVELQGELHDALRAQRPDWIEEDGKSPTCNYYECLFAALLLSDQAHARAHYDHLLDITAPEQFFASANFSIPVSYVEARNIVFLNSAVRGRSLFNEK